MMKRLHSMFTETSPSRVRPETCALTRAMEKTMSDRKTNHACSWMRVVGTAIVALSMTMCGGAERPAGDESVEESTLDQPDVSTLTPESSDEDIMRHMLWVMENRTTSTELTRRFPDIDRARAYNIQRLRLEHREQTAERVGWKIGWSNQPDPNVAIDPAFGHILASDMLEPGLEVPASRLINGKTGVEAEVVFWLDKDLPGPTVTREDVIDATAEVAGAIEIIEPRVAHGSESLDWPNRHNHGIVDNVWHSGVMFGPTRVSLDAMDLAAETVTVAVNDEPVLEGRMSWTMGRDPIEGVVWLANEMLAYGYQLSAGDFVITGSVVYRDSVLPGDSVILTYSSLGQMQMTIASAP
jgi:2-keto-4-pentenoate hydratase